MTAATPVPATREFCDELRRTAHGRGVKHWARTRRLLGGVWTELGIHLTLAGRHKEAAQAAVFALIENPLLMGRESLSRLIAQLCAGGVRRACRRFNN